MEPYQFQGELNFKKANKWVQNMKKNLEVLHTFVKLRVSLVLICCKGMWIINETWLRGVIMMQHTIIISFYFKFIISFLFFFLVF